MQLTTFIGREQEIDEVKRLLGTTRQAGSDPAFNSKRTGTLPIQAKRID
jgi:hypothetical protein